MKEDNKPKAKVAPKDTKKPEAKVAPKDAKKPEAKVAPKDAKKPKAKVEPKEVKKTEPSKETAGKKEVAKNYHITQRKEDGKWQVKSAGSEKVIKLFDTQAEAIAYTNKMAKNQDGNITIHKKDGKIRKLKY